MDKSKKENKWKSKIGVDLRMPLSWGVSYDEYGHVTIHGGGHPTKEEWVNLKLKAQKYAEECNQYRKEQDKRWLEFQQNLWETAHPIQTWWVSIKQKMYTYFKNRKSI